MKKNSTMIRVVLDILQKEIDGDVKGALALIDAHYSMTWVYKNKKGEVFPHTVSNVKKAMESVYPIKGREYDIKNIAEGVNVVMIEMVESYPDPKTRRIYRTPLVVVLEFYKNKIRTGRHYCDPHLSYLHLTKRQVEAAYKNKRGASVHLQ